jgi:TetR/AcrR family fatty acid metabolism transcriptional regulator
MSNSPRARTKSDVVSEFREAEIIDAVRRVIVRDGFRNTSMEKVAEEANISKGTLYLYFENKEDLVRKATERGHAEMAGVIEKLTQETLNPDDAIVTYVRAMLEFCDGNEVLFRAMEAHPDSEGEKSATSVNRRIDHYVLILQRIIDDGIRVGKYRELNSRRVARMIVEAVRGVVIERLRERANRRVSVASDVEMLVSCFMRGMSA